MGTGPSADTARARPHHSASDPTGATVTETITLGPSESLVQAAGNTMVAVIGDTEGNENYRLRIYAVAPSGAELVHTEAPVSPRVRAFGSGFSGYAETDPSDHTNYSGGIPRAADRQSYQKNRTPHTDSNFAASRTRPRSCPPAVQAPLVIGSSLITMARSQPVAR